MPAYFFRSEPGARCGGGCCQLRAFHGVSDHLGPARTVAASLKPEGKLGIVNWHRRPLKETVVLGQPRGPKTEMRIEADDVTAIVKPAGLLVYRTVELPPYHYGVVLRRRSE